MRPLFQIYQLFNFGNKFYEVETKTINICYMNISEKAKLTASIRYMFLSKSETKNFSSPSKASFDLQSQRLFAFPTLVLVRKSKCDHYSPLTPWMLMCKSDEVLNISKAIKSYITLWKSYESGKVFYFPVAWQDSDQSKRQTSIYKDGWGNQSINLLITDGKCEFILAC